MLFDKDDEIFQGFVEESLERLSSIENDLLCIEDAKADIDEALINKVFRTAHSIKGGAGFMGLSVIQELSYAMENILGFIRSRDLVPTPDIINTLIIAADQLQALIEDTNNSNNVDITCHLNALNAIEADLQRGCEDTDDEIPIVTPEVLESLAKQLQDFTIFDREEAGIESQAHIHRPVVTSL